MNQITKAIQESDNDLFKPSSMIIGNVRYTHFRDRKILEAVKEMTRDMFYEYNDSEIDFAANQRSIKLRNDLINALDEVIKDIK